MPRAVAAWVVMVTAFALSNGCARTSQPIQDVPPDPTQAAWYRETLERAQSMEREAAQLVQKRESEKASEIILQAQPLANTLLSVPHPSLAAMEAASDLDDLYARMLFANKHYGWARLFYQKNVAR